MVGVPIIDKNNMEGLFEQNILQIIYAGHSIKGLYHANEDTFSIAKFNNLPSLCVENAEGLLQYRKKGLLQCTEHQCPKLLAMESLEVSMSTEIGHKPSTGLLLRDSLQAGSVQGLGRTGFNTVHFERHSSQFPFIRISSEQAFCLTCCDGHDSDTAAKFVSLELAKALQNSWYKRLSQTLRRISGVEDANDDALRSPTAAHPSLGQTWQTIGSLTSEIDDTKRRVQGAFNKAFRDLESNFRSYTIALTSEHGLPECTAGACVISTLIFGTSIFCANLGDCRAGFLSLDIDLISLGAAKKTDISHSDISGDSRSSVAESSPVFNLSAVPVCSEETVPPIEIFQRSVTGDVDAPPCGEVEDEPRCSIEENRTPVECGHRLVRQMTKLTHNYSMNFPRIEILRDSSDSKDLSENINGRNESLVNLDDEFGSERLVNSLSSPGATSNQSMIVGTSMSTPLSLVLSEPAPTDPRSDSGDEMVIVESELTREEKSEQDAKLKSVLNAFNLAQQIPQPKLQVVNKEKTNTGDCGIEPKFRLQWLNSEHRLTNPDELHRVKILGGIVEHSRIGGLEPSRTIGDFDVKATQNPGVLSIVPYVSTLEIERPGLLFIATDGFWDSFGGEAVVRLLKRNKKLWPRILKWLSQPIERDISVIEELKFKSKKKKSNRRHTDSYPSTEELSQIASLLTKEGRKQDGDDCTCLVVYLCPARSCHPINFCGKEKPIGILDKAR